MGIYSSGMSCWQRRMAGLAQDNAGPKSIDDEATPVVEIKKEEKVVESKPKKVPANSTKSSGL